MLLFLPRDARSAKRTVIHGTSTLRTDGRTDGRLTTAIPMFLGRGEKDPPKFLTEFYNLGHRTRGKV